jgi:serine/threonine protein phosphatase 1
MLTFAIGDIHGRLDKLDKVLCACFVYWMATPVGEPPPTYVFLGDVIDRGPDSKAVIDRILWLREKGGVEVVTLMGNHESMFVGAMVHHQQDIGRFWATHGGLATLASYGPPPRAQPIIDLHVENYYRHLKLFHDDGQLFFVHAGVDLMQPLHTQPDELMLWGHGVMNPGIDPGRYVVHGHIKQMIPRPIPQKHHINLDTAAYLGGPLSCAVFDSAVAGGPVALICDDKVIELERQPA